MRPGSQAASMLPEARLLRQTGPCPHLAGAVRIRIVTRGIEGVLYQLNIESVCENNSVNPMRKSVGHLFFTKLLALSVLVAPGLTYAQYFDYQDYGDVVATFR